MEGIYGMLRRNYESLSLHSKVMHIYIVAL
jgi:hypothetical protein